MTDIYREDIESIIEDSNISWNELSYKTIMVTGATGLLGTLITRTLIVLNREKKLGCHIIAVVRNNEKAKKLYEEEINEEKDIGLEFVVTDIRSFRSYDGNVDYIIHAASETSSKSFVDTPVEVSETALEGTINILRLARDKHVNGMVFLSTMEVYGTPTTDEIIYEERVLPVDPSLVRNSYPIGKIACESLCISYAKEFGIPINILRLTQTFGAGVDYSDSRVFAEFARCALEGRDIVLKTRGETKRSYLYTSDAIRAIFTILMSKGEEGKPLSGEIYNVANERSYCSIADMAKMVLSICGRDGQQVRFDLTGDTSEFGYAPTLCMNLDTSKIQERGWRATYSLEDMYRRMCHDMNCIKR